MSTQSAKLDKPEKPPQEIKVSDPLFTALATSSEYRKQLGISSKRRLVRLDDNALVSEKLAAFDHLRRFQKAWMFVKHFRLPKLG